MGEEGFPNYGLSMDHAPHPSRSLLLHPLPPNQSFLVYGSSPPLLPETEGGAVARAMAASKIHSLAEKKRRERINNHLSTLRRMIPNAHKMDKATLLGKVIDQVKYLKRKAIEIGQRFPIPKEINQVTVERIIGDNHDLHDAESSLIKVSICCDDRPDLFAELIQAFLGLGLRMLKADLATLGGRVQNVFIVCMEDGNESGCLSSRIESLKEVLGRLASSELASNVHLGKRQRVLQSHFSSMNF